MLKRREFLKTVATTGLAVCGAGEAQARSAEGDADGYGVLVDTTQCIGCRKCEWACNEINHLPQQSLEAFEDKSVFAEARRPDADRFTVVNEYPPKHTDGRPIWVKVQCMHCADPACASACLVTAFHRETNGAISYDASRCMGCRYCMVACPFQIPAYEYQEPLTPRIRKCTFCWEKVSTEGGAPACVEICPPQCLTFGKRSDLLALGHAKIARQPEKYFDHVYGEHEVGGTSWLYVGDRPITELGLPDVPQKAPPRLTESIQHGVFKGFLPPLGLYAVLSGVAWLFRGRGGGDNPGHSGPVEEEAAPVRHKLLTPGTWVLLALMAAGLGFALARFVQGLAAVTNLSNPYPWGIWIAIDVATGVALAAGGFTTAALAHVFHRESYHPIVRPALLSALLGYTFVVLGLLVDLGRYYNVWHPMMPSMWSGHSVLFEVGMCVMAYLTVLYFEFVPIVTEHLQGRIRLPGMLRRLEPAAESVVRVVHRSFRRVMMVLVIAGVVLSCLHQSSLGSLMLLAPTKMHPLWYTPILPLLFLLSAIAVGYPVVIFESLLSAKVFRREPETELLAGLGRIVPLFLGVYLVFKISDLVIRDAGLYLLDGSFAAGMFLTELGLGVVLPMALLFSERIRRSARGLLVSAALVLFGVALNRINVFLVAYSPVYAPESPYFPSVGEIAVTVGLVSGLLLLYRVIVTYLPVLPATRESGGH